MTEKLASQAEVWDDSELLDSWNEALEEYKKYHSLAAKGERVNLGASQLGESIADNAPSSQAKTTVTVASTSAVNPSTKDHATAETQPTVMAAAPMLPQALLGTVQDGDMKNLIMSWYYAGYYTGLYEGKQQGYAQAMQREGE